MGMIGDIAPIIKGAAALVRMFEQSAEKASKDKETYIGKLEQATGEDIFKYILLINVSALEGYVAQTRIQAEQSFRLSKIVAVLGFFILLTGIGLGIYQSLTGGASLDAAYFSFIGWNNYSVHLWCVLLPL